MSLSVQEMYLLQIYITIHGVVLLYKTQQYELLLLIKLNLQCCTRVQYGTVIFLEKNYHGISAIIGSEMT